jgi:lipid A 4'-phosphatase
MSMNAASAAPRPWRAREREWALLALAVAAACAVFSLWPQIDLWVSRGFHADGLGFPAARHPWVVAVHEAVPWITRALAVASLVVAVRGWRRPQWLPRHLRRRWAALGLCLLLGVGVVVNGLLKEGWGRARPVAVQELGGGGHFEPALRPSTQCRRNCSFVSGHAASGFAVAAWGLFAAPAQRRRWLLAGLALGAAIGLMRIAQGGHFASDIVFAALVMLLVHASVREAWLRWRCWRRRPQVHARHTAAT